MSRARQLADSADLSFDDGTLVVDSANNRVGIGETSPSAPLTITAATADADGALGSQSPQFTIHGGNTNNPLEIGMDNSGATAVGFIQSRNTISGTQYLALNPNGGNVGIGTSSPASTLSVTTSDSDMATFNGTGAQGGYIAFERSGSAKGYIGSAQQLTAGSNDDFTVRATNNLTFAIGASERMRIDNSGNLLVGKTSASFSVAGVRVRGDTVGIIEATSANNMLVLNRLTSDGDMATFYKDSTKVGSIGANLGKITIGTDDTALFFDSLYDAIGPRNTNGDARDNAIDLGRASHRFKDLYLSGGVYLGGTGAANYLDDYEEGDYTATITPSSGTVNLYGIYNQLSYTKVGRMVTVMGQIVVNSVSTPSGGFTVNLPFVVANLTDLAGRSFTSVVSYFNGTGVTDGYYNTWCRALEGTSEIQIYTFNGASIDSNAADWLGPGSDIIINMSYFTDA